MLDLRSVKDWVEELANAGVDIALDFLLPIDFDDWIFEDSDDEI